MLALLQASEPTMAHTYVSWWVHWRHANCQRTSLFRCFQLISADTHLRTEGSFYETPGKLGSITVELQLHLDAEQGYHPLDDVAVTVVSLADSSVERAGQRDQRLVRAENSHDVALEHIAHCADLPQDILE